VGFRSEEGKSSSLKDEQSGRSSEGKNPGVGMSKKTSRTQGSRRPSVIGHWEAIEPFDSAGPIFYLPEEWNTMASLVSGVFQYSR